MKNFKLLLATAVVFAVGSAFTASNKAVEGEYVLIDGTYQLKSSRPTGECQDMTSQICDYTKTNPSGNNQNPANFTPHQTDAAWVE